MSEQAKNLTSKQIIELLTQALRPTHLEVIDEATLHVDHAHAGKGHFRIIISSPFFEDKSRIETHRAIHSVLEPFMNNGIHALTIHATA
ncbi:MAG: BolA family protein [Saezia sp.]